MDKIKRFEGRVALITGGGSGIGCATALRFAEEGAMVAVADINSSNGEEGKMARWQDGKEFPCPLALLPSSPPARRHAAKLRLREAVDFLFAPRTEKRRYVVVDALRPVL